MRSAPVCQSLRSPTCCCPCEDIWRAVIQVSAFPFADFDLADIRKTILRQQREKEERGECAKAAQRPRKRPAKAAVLSLPVDRQKAGPADTWRLDDSLSLRSSISWDFADAEGGVEGEAARPRAKEELPTPWSEAPRIAEWVEEPRRLRKGNSLL